MNSAAALPNIASLGLLQPINSYALSYSYVLALISLSVINAVYPALLKLPVHEQFNALYVLVSVVVETTLLSVNLSPNLPICEAPISPI